MGLKIAPKHTKDAGKENGRRENPQYRHGIPPHQNVSEHQRQNARCAADHHHIHESAMKDLPCVPVLSQCQPVRDHLGNRGRNAVRGYQKDDGIDLICEE